VELHTCDDLGGGAYRGEVVEEFRAGRTHRQAAREHRRELLHAEERDMPAHRFAGEIRPLRRAAAVGSGEEIAQRDRVEQTLTGHVAVAAIARRRPRESLFDEVLADPVHADSQIRSVRAGVRHEPVREQHQLAVPFLGNLDAVEAAVVDTGQRLRAGQRLERGIAERPHLVGTRHRSHSRSAKSARRLRQERGEKKRDSGGARQNFQSHRISLREATAAWRSCRADAW
jgi:hypothetical protein